ncbi:MAG: hypothetical protein ACRDP1_05320 [Nocardioidaceae bacterium]
MASYNTITWLPWTVLLFAGGLFLAWRAWRAGDYPAATRRVGWALVPWAFQLLGLYLFVWRLITAVSLFAGHFVFSPSAWIGLAVGALGVGLIAFGLKIDRQRTRGGWAFWRRRRRTTGDAAKASTAITGRRSAPAASAGDDMADIEEILKRRGIS